MKTKEFGNVDAVCGDCGKKYGEPVNRVVGMWTDVCDICGDKKGCCAPRDYKYLKKLTAETNSPTRK